MTHKPRQCGWILVVLLGVVRVVSADQPSPKAQQLEYDPNTGQWIESPPPVPGTPLGDLQLARRAYAREEYGKAYRSVGKWLKTYGPQDVLYPEALLLRAEVEIARGDYYKAHHHLQEFLSEYGGTELAERAARFEFVIAEVFLSGKRRKWLGLRIFRATDTGVEILDELAASFPDSSLAQEAIKTKADHYYFRQQEFVLAEMEYSRLVEEFPRSQWVRYAMRQSASAALASFGGIDFDDAPLIEAEDRFSHYLAQYPGSAEQEGIGQILQQIHAQRAAKELSIGGYYERTGHPRAAAFYYRSTADNWPDTIAATQARQRLASLGADQEPAQSQAMAAEAETESAS
ncbi:MAG: outer membrane protein assembly factor BamD [Planctomycetota bacterium]